MPASPQTPGHLPCVRGACIGGCGARSAPEPPVAPEHYARGRRLRERGGCSSNVLQPPLFLSNHGAERERAVRRCASWRRCATPRSLADRPPARETIGGLEAAPLVAESGIRLLSREQPRCDASSRVPLAAGSAAADRLAAAPTTAVPGRNLLMMVVIAARATCWCGYLCTAIDSCREMLWNRAQPCTYLFSLSPRPRR